jgi:polyhydroxyalkanoate synthesis repressor PhaR
MLQMRYNLVQFNGWSLKTNDLIWSESMSEATVQITRYPNRRFYARDTSTYVSLEDIETMVRKGQNVEIRDSQSDENLTAVVLARLIMERQPEKMNLFPIDMLHCMVRSNEVMSDFLRDYFRQVMPYLEYLQQHGTAAMNLAQKPMHWIKAWLDNLTPGSTSGKSNAKPSKPAKSDKLSRRVAELEQRLKQLETQKKE